MKCEKCGKEFYYEVHHMNVPGGKDREYIFCPYCKETNDSVVTDGWVSIYTAEEYEARNRVFKLKDAKSGIELRTFEEMQAIENEVNAKIEDSNLRVSFLNSANIEAITKLMVNKGILTTDEIREEFFNVLENNIKKI